MAKDRAKRGGGGGGGAAPTATATVAKGNSSSASAESSSASSEAALRADCDRAVAAQRRGNESKSVRLITEIGRKSGWSLDAIRTYVGICSRLSGYSKNRNLPVALDVACKASQAFPSSREHALVYAQALHESQRYDEAYAEAERGVELGGWMHRDVIASELESLRSRCLFLRCIPISAVFHHSEAEDRERKFGRYQRIRLENAVHVVRGEDRAEHQRKRLIQARKRKEGAETLENGRVNGADDKGKKVAENGVGENGAEKRKKVVENGVAENDFGVAEDVVASRTSDNEEKSLAESWKSVAFQTSELNGRVRKKRKQKRKKKGTRETPLPAESFGNGTPNDDDGVHLDEDVELRVLENGAQLEDGEQSDFEMRDDGSVGIENGFHNTLEEIVVEPTNDISVDTMNIADDPIPDVNNSLFSAVEPVEPTTRRETVTDGMVLTVGTIECTVRYGEYIPTGDTENETYTRDFETEVLTRDDEPEVKCDAEIDVKGDGEPEVNPDAEPDVNLDAEHDVNRDAEPDVKGGAESDVKGDAEAKTKPEVDVLCRSFDQLGPTSDGEVEAEVEEQPTDVHAKPRRRRPRRRRRRPGQQQPAEEAITTVTTVTTVNTVATVKTVEGSSTEQFDDVPVGKGLQNAPGNNDCFLNGVVQALWHVISFRKVLFATPNHAKECSCVGCELKYTFRQLSSDDGKYVDASRLRTSLSVAYAETNMFQMSQMNDASEALEAVLSRLHYAFNQKCTDGHPRKSCPAHGMFGIDRSEHVRCGRCNAVSRQVHFTNFTQIVYAAEMRAGKSLDKIFTGSLEENSSCLKCGAMNSYTRSTSVSSIFALAIGWQSSRENIAEITATVEAIQTRINLGQAYGFAPSGDHKLISVICFYGMHFQAFCLDNTRWVMFSDTSVRTIGSWDGVVMACCQGHLQPHVLLYESTTD